jgi:ParB/RepB/Spo0J family partition protein
MSTQTAEYARASLVPTKDIEEAPWNVNVCPPEKYETLKADLKTSGPKGTDPIHVCTLGGKQYTIDGAHRLRAAKELGWPVIYAYFHDEITTEEQARLFNYKRDAERGDIDPFKLATAFKWFQDAGMKQEDIAAKFGVDVSTISRRLSLLKVDEAVKKQVVTDTRMTVSHLEPLATLPPNLQARAAARPSPRIVFPCTCGRP